MPKREFLPIISDSSQAMGATQGVMAQSRVDSVTVDFQVDCKDMYVRKCVYIAGNHELLGNWDPNKVRLFDDGTHGDQTAHDGIWSLEVQLPMGLEIEYKYTNSGAEGSWNPGEEFPMTNRKLKVSSNPGTRQIIYDRFGKI